MHGIPVWQSARKKWRYDFKPTKEVPVYHTDVYRLTSSPDWHEHMPSALAVTDQWLWRSAWTQPKTATLSFCKVVWRRYLGEVLVFFMPHSVELSSKWHLLLALIIVIIYFANVKHRRIASRKLQWWQNNKAANCTNSWPKIWIKTWKNHPFNVR